MRRGAKTTVLLLTALLSVACVGSSAAPRVRVLSSPVFSVLPFVWMQETGALSGIDLQIELSPDHQRNLSLTATGQGEFLVTGLNVGAKAYAKGIALQLVNVNAWALDYVVARDSAMRNWADLRGKRIGLPLQGGPVDFLVQYLIDQEGLEAGQFDLIYAPVPQALQLFNLGQLDAVVIPEPQVSQLLAANPKAFLVLDVQKEWAKWHRGEEDIPYVGLFVGSAWAHKNPALAEQVAQAYAKGLAWMNANPEAASRLGAKVLGIDDGTIRQALKRTRFAVYDRARTKALSQEHLEEMLQFNPDLVGGKVPDDAFYR